MSRHRHFHNINQNYEDGKTTRSPHFCFPIHSEWFWVLLVVVLPGSGTGTGSRSGTGTGTGTGSEVTSAQSVSHTHCDSGSVSLTHLSHSVQWVRLRVTRTHTGYTDSVSVWPSDWQWHSQSLTAECWVTDWLSRQWQPFTNHSVTNQWLTSHWLAHTVTPTTQSHTTQSVNHNEWHSHSLIHTQWHLVVDDFWNSLVTKLLKLSYFVRNWITNNIQL